MSRLFILLFSVLTLTGSSACAQAQDAQSDIVVSEDGKLDMEALLKEAKEKRDASAAELEQEKAQTTILKDFVEIAEKPTDDEWDLGFGEELERVKTETARTAAELEREKAETAREKAETVVFEEFLEIAEKPTD